MEEASWRAALGGTWRHLGNIWEASGEHLEASGGIWEGSGKGLGGAWERPGGIWGSRPSWRKKFQKSNYFTVVELPSPCFV